MNMKRRNMIRTHLVGIILILGLAACAGSTKAPQPGPAFEPSKVSLEGARNTPQVPPRHVKTAARKGQSRQSERHLAHKVKWPGESLSIIAKWYTGEFNHWKTLADFNPRLKPDRIWVGQEILVPESLLKTWEPMPKSFVGQFVRKSKKKQSPHKKDNALPLFGPRDYSSK